MRNFGMIFKEMVHHRVNAILSVLAVMATVAMCIALVITQEASYRETKRIMRDMGHPGSFRNEGPITRRERRPQ